MTTAILASYLPLLNLVILNCGLALSQYVVLRAGVFSVATPALASVGAYTAGILVLRYNFPAPLAFCASTIAGTAAARFLSMPLARLRGVFQAIATVAAVQICLSLVLYASDFTGGPNGLNGISRAVDTPSLVLFISVTLYVLAALGRSYTGAAFDAIRQDETVAVSLGISTAWYQAVAFALSGAIAGATGALMALYNYSIVPEEFGFGLLVSVLTFVVLGGSRSVLGPIVGASILTLLPEIARPLADNRMVIHGALLIAVIIYLPHGIVDSLRFVHKSRKASPLRADATSNRGSHART